MKKVIAFLFILSMFSAKCFAGTVGTPDMTVPDESLYFKQDAVDRELNRYEYNFNVRASLDIEITTSRDLESADADTPTAVLKGQSFMVKFSDIFYDVVEPYIKIGTSNFEIKWDQYNRNVKVETNNGFVWAAGFKLKLYEFEQPGIKVTLDAQYRDTELDIDKVKLGGASPSIKNENFQMDEWQLSLVGSKKYVVPFGNTDYYIVTYGGVTYIESTIDAGFTDVNNILYSTFDANDKNALGLVLGCDIMPFYMSWYLLSFELRLLNETAFTLGGTMKF